MPATLQRAEGRPSAGRAFSKAHGLGNDYLVFEEGASWVLSPAAVAGVCDRTRGVGSDGIVLVERGELAGGVRVRMFNPDGSEFERSGNGLRILAAHLHRQGRVGRAPFRVYVGGGHVEVQVLGASGTDVDVSVRMGRASVGPEAVGLDRAALDGKGRLPGPDGEPLSITPVWVGNPHLVAWWERPTEGALPRMGPFLATHPALRRGANVQLAVLAERERVIDAGVWERGVGRTSASGTSACAVAVAAVHEGFLSPGGVEVRMEGGSLSVDVSAELDVVLRGPVREVCQGVLDEAFASGLQGVGGAGAPPGGPAG